MLPELLFVIDSDPRRSHRPAEAIRIAAGIGASEEVTLSVFLGETAFPMLQEREDLIDTEELNRNLAVLERYGHRIYIPLESAAPASPRWAYEPISSADLAGMSASCDYLIRF